MTFAEYRSYDALGLAELVRTGQVSPQALLDLAIARAEEVNPAINAIIHPLYERARTELQQRSATADSPFAGLPFLIKDLGLALQGTPLRIGSRSTAGDVSTESSYLVNDFEAAGMTIFGKTNTPEFGLTPFTEPELFGPTRNPWNTDYTAGGSSGGSAAAIAAGIVPLATASDGGGSIRMPASCCGLFGLKPSRGRLSLGPAAGEMWGGAVVEGCNSRSVRDSAAFLDHFSRPGVGELYHAPQPTLAFSSLQNEAVGKLRIAYSTEHPLGLPVDKDVIQAVENAVELLVSLGHEVEAVPLPYQREDLTETFLHHIMGEVNAELRRIGKQRGRKVARTEVEANTYALNMLGDTISAGEYAYHRSQWNDLARRQGRFHQTYDCLLTPTVALAPFPIGGLQATAAEALMINVLNRLRLGSLLKANIGQLAEKVFAYMPFTPIANMTGQPAMSVPLHWNAKGLPVGVMFTSAIYREDILFRLAFQLEAALPWMNKVPELG